MAMNRKAMGICALAGLFFCSAALAQPATDPEPSAEQKAEAKARFEKGVKLFVEERYPAALAEFQRSYAIRPKPVVLFNIANCQKAVGDYVGSIRSFEKYLAEAGDSSPPAEREKIAALMAEMRADLGAIRIVASEAGISVSLDGAAAVTTPIERPIDVSPGEHRVAATAPDGRAGERALIVTAGEQVEIDLENLFPRLVPPSEPAVSPAPLRESTVAPAPPPPKPLEAPKQPARAESPAPRLTPAGKSAIAFFTIGVAAVVVGGALAGETISAGEEWERSLSLGDKARAEHLAVGANVCLFSAIPLGLAGIISAGVAIKEAKEKKTRAGSPAGEAKLSIAPGPEGAALLVQGRF